jgi:hypothetical protein
MAAHAWATWHHTICQKDATCHKIHSPTCLPLDFQLNSSTSSNSASNSATTCGSIPCHVSLYTDCTVNKILPVWKNEQNMISHSSDVCLNPFELRWVREDEAYTPVHFEAILSTLIFEQNLIH